MKILSNREYERLENSKKEVTEVKKAHKKELAVLNKQITDLEAENKVLNQLQNDAVEVRVNSLENEEERKVLKQKELNLDKRTKALEKKETAEYKSGYQDGVADGLRKGYDLTASDRQNMASIAALAAASHSDGATKLIAEQIVVGMQQRELPATTKKQ